jgi:hypothetical protein
MSDGDEEDGFEDAAPEEEDQEGVDDRLDSTMGSDFEPDSTLRHDSHGEEDEDDAGEAIGKD